MEKDTKLKIGERKKEIYSFDYPPYHVEVEVEEHRIDNLNYLYSARFLSGKNILSLESDKDLFVDVPYATQKKVEKEAIAIQKNKESEAYKEMIKNKRIGRKDSDQGYLFDIPLK